MSVTRLETSFPASPDASLGRPNLGLEAERNIVRWMDSLADQTNGRPVLLPLREPYSAFAEIVGCVTLVTFLLSSPHNAVKPEDEGHRPKTPNGQRHLV